MTLWHLIHVNMIAGIRSAGRDAHDNDLAGRCVVTLPTAEAVLDPERRKDYHD